MNKKKEYVKVPKGLVNFMLGYFKGVGEEEIYQYLYKEVFKGE